MRRFSLRVVVLVGCLAAAGCPSAGDDDDDDSDASAIDGGGTADADERPDGEVIDAPPEIPDSRPDGPEWPDAPWCDGLCAGAWECETCPSDCPELCEPFCGDGYCDEWGGECGWCPEDCAGICDACGDDFCDEWSGECDTCPLDCAGICGGTCGDGTCLAAEGETCVSCAADCVCVCGNGLCEAGECGDTGTCPADCPDGCSTCSHDLCVTGGVLASGCDPCVDMICMVDSYCCDTSWDITCVGEVGSVCGLACPATCGDWMCTSPPEDCTTCPTDCGSCPICGDGWCYGEPSENCEKCPADCGPCPSVCGANGCEAGETCVSCSTDCGPCFCGDGVCEYPMETCASCVADCGPCVCGDLVCNPGESCSSCPLDCECVPCAHSICTPGVALDADCDPCVEMLCIDWGYTWCCTTAWDEWCVSDAMWACGKACGGTPPPPPPPVP